MDDLRRRRRPRRPRPPWPVLPLRLLLACWLLGGATAALPRSRLSECYVCGPQQGLLAGKSVSGKTTTPGPSSVPSCSGFTPDDARYRQICPSPFEGCIHERDDLGNVARSCGNVHMNLCQTANKIIYCFCRDPLCNAWPSDSEPWPMVRDRQYVHDSAFTGGESHLGDGPSYREDEDDDEDTARFEHSGGGPPPSSPSLQPGDPIPSSPTAGAAGAVASASTVAVAVAIFCVINVALL